MIVVAFMQNMWMRKPERFRATLARIQETDGHKSAQEFRRRFIAYGLFAGCLTGRRLEKAFGEKVCQEIIWEESTQEVAGDPKTIFPAQPEHIRAVLEEFQPHVVLTFGRIALAAVKPLWVGKLIAVPHPAARQPDTIARLAAAAVELKDKIRCIE